MAIVEMRKVTAIARVQDRERITKTLVDFGVAEVRELGEIDEFDGIDLSKRKEEIESKLSKLSFALKFIQTSVKDATKLAKKKSLDYQKPKKDLLGGKIALTLSEFEQARANEKEVFDVVNKLETLSKRKVELQSDIAKQRLTIESLSWYKGVDLAFDSFGKGNATTSLLGLIKSEKRALVKQITEKYPSSVIEGDFDVEKPPKYLPIAIVTPNADVEDLLKDLQSVEFQKCAFDYSATADDEIERISKEEIEVCSREIDKIVIDCAEFYDYTDKIKILYDCYKTDYSVQEAVEKFKFTDRTVVFGFWTPAKDVDVIKGLIEKADIPCYIQDEEPDENDFVPTLMNNNPVVAPYESITNMYSVPSYREKDPNTIMSVFYFILFGIMLGDAAYGILMAIGAFTLYFLKKRRHEESKMLLVIGMGGISTAIWGFIFGSWFGITPDKSKLWYWFSPIEDPLKMLILSLAVGFIQIIVGMFMQSLKLFREHKPLEAVFNVYGWYVVFIGIGMYAIDSFLVKVDGLATAGMITAIVGLAMLLIGGALGKNKKFFSRILGGFKNIYGVTNILSDVFSYARLFGLGLATAVVAMVVNQICSVIRSLLSVNVVGAIFGWIITIVIYVVGHVFNMAINALGTYVHNCRLQYVEFYGRFYEGGGRLFAPLGNDKKYTCVKSAEQAE